MKIEKNKLLNQIKKKKEDMEKIEAPDTEKKKQLQRLRAQIKRLTNKK